MPLTDLDQLVVNIMAQAPPEMTTRENGHPLFRAPLIGVQSAEHPHFDKLQNLIPDHVHPRDVITNHTGPVSVIGVILPISEQIVRENGAQQDLPAHSWLIGKQHHVQMIKHVTTQLCAHFEAQNIPAVAVDQTDLFRHWRTRRGAPRTTWSHRHVAFGCGLGTFGLHGALITQSGATHRIITLVVGCAFPEYAHVPDNPFRDCLYLSHDECGACIERCPVGAITSEGHDTVLCESQCRGRVTETLSKQLPKTIPAYGCALCMCDVPCSLMCPEPFQN